MSQVHGKRNLALIRKSGSTSRILNLLAAHERFHDKPDYQAKPVFRNKRLNQAIIIKHTLRGSEVDLFSNPRTVATKIVFPFARDDLSLGGSYFFVQQLAARDAMRQLAGDAAKEGDHEFDEVTLAALDELPSLDPFLLREGLKRHNRNPALCYFDISEADVERMTEYVSHEIATLIALAFSGTGTSIGSLARQMATKLLSDENTEALLPLRTTLQLSGVEYSEGIFAWKGFLYYKWVYADVQLKIAKIAREMARLRIIRIDSATEAHLTQSRERAVKQVNVLQAFVREALSTYDRAFKDLTEKSRPAAFREFLLNSPEMFNEIGRKLGALMHVSSFWRFKFPENALLRMDADDAIDLFQEFETSLDTGGAASRSQKVW